jgi:hypothetical protein
MLLISASLFASQTNGGLVLVGGMVVVVVTLSMQTSSDPFQLHPCCTHCFRCVYCSHPINGTLVSVVAVLVLLRVVDVVVYAVEVL